MELNQVVTATLLSETQDMRRSRRYKINLHVIISTFVSGINKIIPGYGRNLGEGGMCVYVPAQLSLGGAVEIALQLPGAKAKVALHGRIKSVERFNYSIEFISLDQRTQQIIAESCRRLAGAR